MDRTVDHRKDNNAVRKDNQNVTVNGKKLQTEEHKRMATLHRVERQVNIMGKIE